MVVVARIAFFLPLFLSSVLLLLLRYVHGHRFMGVIAHSYIHTHKEERKKKKKNEKKTRPTSNNGGGSGAKKKEKRISKIVRAAHSTTDNVDYYHHRDTYTYYNTYAALASLDE
jgi:hypothetical protein